MRRPPPRPSPPHPHWPNPPLDIDITATLTHSDQSQTTIHQTLQLHRQTDHTYKSRNDHPDTYASATITINPNRRSLNCHVTLYWPHYPTSHASHVYIPIRPTHPKTLHIHHWPTLPPYIRLKATLRLGSPHPPNPTPDTTPTQTTTTTQPRRP